ncbi:polysaccharide biosynthesis/export family protein [Chitinophaga sp. 30R24]|uniref:polysaccharide biosynthesis/export family protein n=1 Tax=Chitinophaga sp. 30R24 TaxID=3248838 RepID=UPI003B908836
MNVIKMPSIFLLSFLCLLLLCSSCASYKSIPYFKNLTDSSYVYKKGVPVPLVPYEEIRIQPDDILKITIQTIDPDMGNLIYTGNENSVVAGSPMNTSPDRRYEEEPGYLVDHDGMVELPVAGKIKVGGLTTAEAREEIRRHALKYYKEPVVNVRIVNFKITVLGEVARPGAYYISGEKVTVLDGLGLAGDMTVFGMRKNVVLVRQENGQQKMVRFDLNDTEMFTSPYFYLRQGDVIYVQPGKGKAAANDAGMARTYAIITSVLSLLVIIVTRIK